MYRSYVMNGLNKMVYRIEDDTIYIVDFWDVRQDPSTLAERKSESGSWQPAYLLAIANTPTL